MKTPNLKTNSSDLAWRELLRTIQPGNVSVTVSNGAVLLEGTVENYSKKQLAEQIVSEVYGVKSIINALEVKLKNSVKRNDDDLADNILDAILKAFEQPEEGFAMKIENEWLVIEGTAMNAFGESVAVKGKLCRLEQVEKPALATKEQAYWEIFN